MLNIIDAIKRITLQEEIPLEDIHYVKDKESNNTYYIFNQSYRDVYLFKDGILNKVSSKYDKLFNKFYKKSQSVQVGKDVNVNGEYNIDELQKLVENTYFSFSNKNSQNYTGEVSQLIAENNKEQALSLIKNKINELLTTNYSQMPEETKGKFINEISLNIYDKVYSELKVYLNMHNNHVKDSQQLISKKKQTQGKDIFL